METHDHACPGLSGAPSAPSSFCTLSPSVAGGFSGLGLSPSPKLVCARGSFHVRMSIWMSTMEATSMMTTGMRPNHQYFPPSPQSSQPEMRGAISSETIAISFSKISNEGPDVSLKGSPTVSPTTHALPCSVFLRPIFSHSFLELSHAPPALPIKIASIAALPMVPASKPMRQRGPMRKPTESGVKTAYKPGAIISFTEERVEIITHWSLSGSTSSSSLRISPFVLRIMASIRVWPFAFFTSRNWRRTSSIISAAAFPTEIIVSAPKR
mmetsp:Transcript_113849/g.219091  ORF Transcript_113849/g.219091 Transcript_113849/m.219091 type:complete len:268 (+) Transcript_113849:229-1032(+)